MWTIDDKYTNYLVVVAVIIICSVMLYGIYIAVRAMQRYVNQTSDSQTTAIMTGNRPCADHVRDMLSEVLECQVETFEMHEKTINGIENILKRQGKLAIILKNMSEANRRHDRKVSYILEQLGEKVPDDMP